MTATQPSKTRVLLLLAISAVLGTFASSWFVVRRNPEPPLTPTLLTEQTSASQNP
jgi:hypothetical protein